MFSQNLEIMYEFLKDSRSIWKNYLEDILINAYACYLLEFLFMFVQLCGFNYLSWGVYFHVILNNCFIYLLKGFWHMHIICSNSLIIVDLGYEWYFMFD